MEFTAKTVKITASPDALHWGVCFAENGFFLTLEVEGDEERSALIAGREILEAILTKFADQDERSLKSVEKLLSDVRDSKALVSLNIAILREDILYLGSCGQGEVLLARKGAVRQILSANETASGRIKDGDTLLVSSKTFLERTTEEKRHHIITLDDQDEVMESLSSLLKQEETVGAAALLISFELKSEKKKLPLNLPKFDNLWQTFKSRVEKISISKKQTGRELKSKRNLLVVAVILVFLLTISIFLNISNKRTTDKKNKLSQALGLVSHQYEEAVSLLDLNPGRSRILLSSSKLSLTPFLKEFPKNSSEGRQIDEWLNKISEAEVAAYKIYKLTSVPIFFDISLIKEKGIGKKMREFGDMKVILDTKNKLVYSLSTKTKQAAIIAGSENVREATTLSIHGKSAYILNSDGVVRIDLEDKKAQLVIERDESWGEIVSMSSFAGNIYLLDKTNNAVWKYIGAERGFLNKASYLNPDVKVNFSQAEQMIIDGSVWILSANDILKFTQGLPEEFLFKDFSDSLESVAAISTNDTDKNLYILDKNTSRIIVFDKEGSYQSQYQWDELKNTDDFVACEEEKKIYVLSGSKIYAVELK